jgi:serine/threonine-protein kinase
VNDETPDGADQAIERLDGVVVAGRYRIEHVVSSGASTVITEAIDIRDDSPVTLKVVRPELALHASFRDEFRRHVETAMSLAHPNIARVLGWGELLLGGELTVFWVVEYLGGGSLRDLFDRGRLLEPSQALVVGLEACRALDAAHRAGVVHSELTPSKLVFGADGRVRVVDFSMAELFGAEAWSEPATLATHVARYASPEQALGLGVDEKTDVYALSLCLIEAITGSVPFAGDSTVSTLAARVGRLMPVTADMGSMAAVLERAGRPEGEDRWTAAEFGAALVQAAETLPRPDPIPIMSSSLFATSLLHRQVAADDSRVPAEEADETLEESPVVEPSTGAGDTVPSDDDTAEHPGELVTAAAAGAFTLLVDAADEPDIDQAETEQIETEQIETEQIETEQIETEQIDTEQIDTDQAETEQLDTEQIDTQQADTTEVLPSAVAATTAVEVVDPTPAGILYDAERDSRPWGRNIAIALLVLVGVVALSIAAFLLLRTKSYEVPDLVGVDQAIALNEVSGNGWVIETDRERSDEVPEIDHVVRTIPAAGEMLDEGATFVIVVSDGPELRTIPELAGMALADAQEQLDELSLVLVEAGSEFSEDVPAGSIIRWEVQGNASLVAGAQVLPDTVIEVTVSQGPEPRPAPDLANLTVDEAEAALDGLQLALALGEEEFSNTVEVGRVVSQDPAPTTPVDRGGTVTVRISKGPDLVPFPDLTGQTYPQALETLEDAGYTENSLLGTTEGTFVSASIDGDEVSPGDTFPRGTGVDLIFL